MPRRLAAVALAIVVSLPLVPRLTAISDYILEREPVVVVPARGVDVDDLPARGFAYANASALLEQPPATPERALAAVDWDVAHLELAINRLIKGRTSAKRPLENARASVAEARFRVFDLRRRLHSERFSRPVEIARRMAGTLQVSDEADAIDSLRQAISTSNGDLELPLPAALDTRDSRFAISQADVAADGWYAIDLPKREQHDAARTYVEFVPTEGDRTPAQFLVRGGDQGSVAVVYTNRPGVLTTVSSKDAAPIRGLGFREFCEHALDLTFRRLLLAVAIAADVLPLILWILSVYVLQIVAHRAIELLPEHLHPNARREIELLLGIAKWSGACSYLVWIGKEMLREFGLVVT